MPRAMAVVLLCVMACDLALPYLLAPFYEGYSHSRMVMSYLGNPGSPVRWVYNGWLFLGGLVFLWCAFGLYLGSQRGALAVAALVLMLLYGVGGMVLCGLFSVGPGKGMDTLPAKIHGIGASLGFMALLFVPLLLAIAAGREGDAPGLWVCGACFVLAFATFALFVMADKPAFKGTVVDNEGTWQRLTLLFMYLPVGYFCVAK